MGETTSIPEPPGLPVLGNIFDIDMELPIKSFCDLAEKLGGIYRMRLPGTSIIVASSYAIVNEFCDEKRFPKNISALKEMRHAIHDGLFTAIDGQQEPNWGIAHRILVPAFGPLSLRSMFDGMYDIASQLTLKWARHGQHAPITVGEDFTRLTLDTIALCSMDYRFNSYYKDGVHPFAEAMTSFLTESGDRLRRLPIPSIFYRAKDRKYFEDIDVMRKTANDILQARKAEKNLETRKDLLSAMLHGVDPKTGQKMTEESILDNLITFLIAGHETTSGMLSFAFYHLIKHPESYRKARQEVDQVCGKTPIKFEHLSKLGYISAVLRETLRLTPPLPVFNVAAKTDEIVGGKYIVRAGELVIMLVSSSQLDPEVFGEDAKDFKPERMLDKEFDRLNKEFPNAWKPFGNGTRGCIGRPFAWQEALLVMGMLLQNFDFEFDDPDYTLILKQTLTLRPANFKIRAIPRGGVRPAELEQRLAGTARLPGPGSATALVDSVLSNQDTKPMSIYYGSNSGTCQSMAERLAADAYSHGFHARIVDYIDNATDKLPADEPVVLITASYEGQPPDNAAKFVNWIENMKGEEILHGVSYAVFGCGHHDWVSTFHRIPKLVDSEIEIHGGSRIAPIGLSDVAKGNELTDFEIWEDDVLWPALTKKYGSVTTEGPTLKVEVTCPRISILHQDVKEASVVATSTLTAKDASVKKQHIEIQLPSDITYRAGDYLAVLPLNPRESVHRVMRHFHLPWDAHLTISTNGRTRLPDNGSVTAFEVLASYVELAHPATKRDILTLARIALDQATKQKFQSLAAEFQNFPETMAKRLSILDLLELNPSVKLPIASFLSMLPPMRVRQYSISSSPFWNRNRAVLTFSVLDGVSFADDGKRRIGVASSYLSGLLEGDVLQVSVRSSHIGFHLPEDREKTPVIMIAAGTGIAPFRGFIQERAMIQAAGGKIATAMLFVGCRDPEKDDLYREDLDGWESDAVVRVRRSYSRRPEESEGCKYVQHLLWKDRNQVMDLWDRGARVYVCGSRAVSDSTKDIFVDMFLDVARKQKKESNEKEVRKWFEGLKNIRYAADVFD